MARRPRLQFPGAVYHVMSRGNRKAAIFADDDDRRCFMNTLAETAIRYRPRVYAVCLMTTHYHAVLDTPRGNLSAVMRQLNGIYSQTCNRRHCRSGHTFEARFHSVVVEGELHLRRATRYVVANPVKAVLCHDASSWPWSTYRATAGLEAPAEWLYLDWLEWAFSADTRSDAQGRYRCYVADRAAVNGDDDLDPTVVGGKAFQKAAQKTFEAEMNQRGRPLLKPSTLPECPSLETIFPSAALTTADQDRYIYAAHVTHGYQLAEIADYLALDASTVGKAFRRYWRGRRS